MMTLLRIATVLVTVILGACAGPATKYYWGSYEQALYQYYKTPSQLEEFAVELAKTIREADQANKKVPPGIYAELGHVLQQQGKLAEARAYYEKERSTWPESTIFMNAMIKNVDSTAKQPQSSGKPQS